MSPALSILGAGVYLPPARAMTEIVADVGCDLDQYRGWENIRVAADDDHPSTMGAMALQDALGEAGVEPTELRIVIFAGMSRDYLPSWSVATEVMRLCRIPSTSIGLDITIGCLGTMTALSLARGWLSVEGGGYGAIVVAERWSQSVDRTRSELMGLWGYSDGGAALVVGLDVSNRSLADFRHASFATAADFNGTVIIPYGGTRFPTVPEGDSQGMRQIDGRLVSRLTDQYRAGYSAAFDALNECCHVRPSRLICNQISPGIVAMLAEIAGVPTERTLVTGHDSGHLGPADVVVALRQLIDANAVDGPVAMASSTAYAWGAAMLVPPGCAAS